MKKIITLIFTLALFTGNSVFSQMKPHVAKLKKERDHPLQPSDVKKMAPFQNAVPTNKLSGFQSNTSFFPSLGQMQKPIAPISNIKMLASKENGLPILIKGKVTDLEAYTIEEQRYQYLELVKNAMQIEMPEEEFVLVSQNTDDLGHSHFKMQQQYNGIPVYGAEIILHEENGNIHLLNGRYYPTPEIDNINPSISMDSANQIALDHVASFTTVKDLTNWEKQMVLGEQTTTELVIYHLQKKINEERLAWKVQVIPNISNRWSYFIDAETGVILQHFNEICQLHGTHNCSHSPSNPAKKVKHLREHKDEPNISMPPPDGPAEADAFDLSGVLRHIHTYEVGNDFFLIDASRDMFNSTQSNFPDESVGTILTVNAQNTAPQNNDFSAVFNTSINNSWNDQLAVSAHYNGAIAYEYFKNTFNRNSINGQGGNIISIINVADEDGGDMDNAFWNGAAMFYGNGDVAFSPLAKSLDVAGHEMSHGVIQNTANLEYFGESGALNESFADVFGAMIDRDDWRMGEEVVNTNVFPSGALRDLQNPHNGGNNLNDNGYQPAHTSEQFTGNGDNGGVHINSGIVNRAFFLFANAIGKDKAEQVYYRALTNYLVKSSQFIDMRIAIVQSATDLHGSNSTEVNAAKSAFDQVGIGAGSGNDTQVDVGENPGDEYIVMADVNQTGLYIFTPNGDEVANPLTTVAPISIPSLTDNGSAMVYVAEDQTIQLITFNWPNSTYQQTTLQDQPMWVNVTVSKDGSRIAALTDDLDNRVWVFDFGLDEWVTFDLYNPTTAEGGIVTGDVLYPDILEFDFTGEWVMYDAFNRIENNQGGDIEYWDIGFLRVFDKTANNWGDGFISKLFSGLPENSSVGNPTFSKNSDFIIAFDFIDDFNDEYFLMGANTETGEIGTIFENNVLSYPNYSISDDQMVFDAESGFFNDPVLAFIPIGNDKISANGDATVYIENATKGVWFATGERELTDTEDAILADLNISVSPNPFGEFLHLSFESERTESVRLELINALGQMVLQEEKTAVAGVNNFELNVAGIESGTYFLRINGMTGSFGLKVLKQ